MDFKGRITFMRTWKENRGKKNICFTSYFEDQFFGFVGHIVKGGLYYPVKNPLIFLTHSFEFVLNMRRSALNAPFRRKL